MLYRFLKAWRRDTSGASAVEFAIVVPLFLALIMSILEVGYFYFLDSSVSQARVELGRLVRTGQLQSSMSEEEALNSVCDVLDSFGNCRDKVTISIQRFDSFQSLSAANSPPACRNAAAMGRGVVDFDLGTSKEIMLVKVCFKQKLISPVLAISQRGTTDGITNLVSAEIFRNEPF